MTALRFALWNIGIWLCDRAPAGDRIPWCPYLHPHRLINGIYGDIPESWWQRWGWT